MWVGGLWCKHVHGHVALSFPFIISQGDNIFLYGACNVLIEMCGIKSLIINEYVAILGIESIMAQKIPRPPSPFK